MAEDLSNVNPWVRAEEERYTPNTEKLIPEGLRPKYIRILKELAHAKGIANLALGQVYIYEQERAEFFAHIQEIQGDNVVYLEDYRGKV